MGINENSWEYLSSYWDASDCQLITNSGFGDISLEFSNVGTFEQDIKEANSILEIGPGSGGCITRISQLYPNKNLSITDIAKAQLDRINIDGLNKYIFLDLPENIADVIYFHLVLQHVPKNLSQEFFQLVYKALKPKGKLYFQYIVAIDYEKTKQLMTSGTILYLDSELLKLLINLGFHPKKIAKIPINNVLYWWGYCHATK